MKCEGLKLRKQAESMNKSKYENAPLIILDNGHGGIIDGKYQTSGKRSPKWEDGRQLFEGEFNRDVVNRIIYLCKDEGIRTHNLIDTEEDVHLNTRTDIANRLYKKDRNCILVSIHANAGGGTGMEIFTSPGQTDADHHAETIILQMEKDFPELRLRADKRDGDHDKEARFAMVVNSSMPAVLVECAFMDTLKPDCELLMSNRGRDRFSLSIFEGIKTICNEATK